MAENHLAIDWLWPVSRSHSCARGAETGPAVCFPRLRIMLIGGNILPDIIPVFPTEETTQGLEHHILV